ncbi:MAG: flippase-like domain-containing protein [Candidatus Diapherotrites archaeon]|uniref:Flippase-like domain-containing protein n=1 Tax=Candidatus Iainarchaeum sp. TaxID=3101447 RepID=A0A8T4LEP3_9ARCH|nr:flippase-like domain-containing protein [Candidatus Diapherotrites archaeon]
MDKRIGIGIGLLILSILYLTVGPEKIIAAFSRFNFVFLLLTLIPIAFTFLVSGLNLYFFAQPVLKISFKESVTLSNLLFAINAFLPGHLGELFVATFLEKKGARLGSTSAMVFLDKLISLVAVLIFVALSVAFFLENTLVMLLLGIAGLMILSFFSLTPTGRVLVRKVIQRFFPTEKPLLEGFGKTIQLYLFEKKRILLNLVLSILRLVIASMTLYIVFLGFGLSPPIIPFVILSIASLLIGYIPITPSGIGLKEGSLVYLYTLISIPVEISLLALTIVLIINQATSGLFFVLYYPTISQYLRSFSLKGIFSPPGHRN